jgi:hypothetical protein
MVAKHNFSRKLCTSPVLSRKRVSADTFENGAFACRLITAHHELWQCNMIANPVGSNTVNLIESFRCFAWLEPRAILAGIDVIRVPFSLVGREWLAHEESQ